MFQQGFIQISRESLCHHQAKRRIGIGLRKAAIRLFVASVQLLLACLLLAVSVYLLWNWLVPSIFGLRQITYPKAWGISLLVRLLFEPWGAYCGSAERNDTEQEDKRWPSGITIIRP